MLVNWRGGGCRGGRFTATAGTRRGHQTDVALSRHRPGRVWARLASALVASLLLAATPCAAPASAAQSGEGGGQGFLNIALPPGGEMVVENRRGGVRVEVWAEDHVALAAAVGGAGRAKGRGLPVGVSHTESLLTIKVADAGPAAPRRVDLTLRVPASARLKVYTSDGALEVRGVPASLVAQTLSGDLTLALPPQADASVTAQSLNGTVTLGEGLEAVGGRVVRGKFQARLGAGGHSVNLFSGRGRVSLTTLSAEADNGATERPKA